ncbi:prepilin-type N-terminal cleavage/methylation domain-containing protein [bacterium]|nr:MAG: prepilin-type N-terminal cleavage/methylation domain-containing protein [bacterium]
MNRRGVTFVELMIGMAMLGIVVTAFASMFKLTARTANAVQTKTAAQEQLRQAFQRAERALLHANEVRVASAAFVEFTCDLDQSSAYDPDGDQDGDGIPNRRDGDRDDDAMALFPSTAQWRVGFNLEDDDEDGDQQVDVVRRLYRSGNALWLDTSVNGSAWGGSRLTRLGVDISTLTFSYWGDKSNTLGMNLDRGNDGNSGTGDSGENDGVVSEREMDMVPAPAGMGDRSGALDTANERRYITSVRVYMGADRSKEAGTDYVIETDVYPPLMALKSR